MKSYQNGTNTVKGSIQVTDAEAIRAQAAAGLLRLSMELGLAVVAQLLEEDVEALAGPRGKHDANRTAYRHGTERTRVVMGGGKVSIEKPRVRGKDGAERVLPSLGLFQNQDPLNEAILNRLLCGVSTRKYERSEGEKGQERHCVSKSEVNRRFIAGMKAQMEEFFARRIEQPIAAVMIDGIEVGGTSILAALGIDEDGKKHMLGITQGGSENSTVAVRLLCDLIDRGLDARTPRLFVLDGGKGIHKAVREVFGDRAVIQRCQVHKKRNVLSHLPKSEQANVSHLMSKAYLEHEYEKAKRLLDSIAGHLDTRYPKAAASLREGLDETLSVHRMGVPGLLRQTLSNTNPIESANSVCMAVLRRIRNWQKSDMILRNMAAGFMEAERGFRRVKGYRQIPLLLLALRNECESALSPPPLAALIR